MLYWFGIQKGSTDIMNRVVITETGMVEVIMAISTLGNILVNLLGERLMTVSKAPRRFKRHVMAATPHGLLSSKTLFNTSARQASCTTQRMLAVTSDEPIFS